MATPNSEPFLADMAARAAVTEGLARTVGQPTDRVAVAFSRADRRLGARSLQGGDINADYAVSLPAGPATSEDADSVRQALVARTAQQDLTGNIRAELARSSLQDTYAVEVASIEEPVLTYGGAGDADDSMSRSRAVLSAAHALAAAVLVAAVLRA